MHKNQFLILSSDFIKNIYLKQCKKEVARLLSLEPDFDWNMITEIDLSYLNIVHISGLRLLRNLSCLRLTQNFIRKIENLGWLSKLEHLDLSYNMIEKIENLEGLKELKFLGLSGNKISVLENLDVNLKLQTFLINDNKITEIGQIWYLKRFKELQVLDVLNNLAINDAMQEVVDQLPQLKYLNTKLLDQSRTSVPHQEENQSDSDEQEFEDIELAFLYTDIDGKRFVNHLFKNDEHGKLLTKWNCTVRNAFEVYKKNMTRGAKDFFNLSLERLNIRKQNNFAFKVAFYTFEKQWTQKSRDMIREYEEIRMLRMENYVQNSKDYLKLTSDEGSLIKPHHLSIKKQFNSVDSSMKTSVFDDELFARTDQLYVNNIYINKSIMEMIGKYQKLLDDELKSFIEQLIPIFFNLREVENVYSSELADNVKVFVNDPKIVIMKDFMDHFKNRSDILQAVFKSTDTHLDLIYKREEMLVNDLKKWTVKTIEDLKNEERKRFWMVCEEIRRYRQYMGS